MPITNLVLKQHPFLREMYDDGYFPNRCVDRVKAILVNLCERIEAEKPADLDALYRLSHAATEEINELESYFEEHGSEIETGAREAIAADFATIASAYGFAADVEELIAPREW